MAIPPCGTSCLGAIEAGGLGVAEHQVEVLHRRAALALHQVVDRRNNHRSIALDEQRHVAIVRAQRPLERRWRIEDPHKRRVLEVLAVTLEERVARRCLPEPQVHRAEDPACRPEQVRDEINLCPVRLPEAA